ncbi:unnamed protein product [Cuscuta epithymum]|uniref:DNA-directed RNA polymerase III subunit RPC5 n=1 Tax=Cuscuta epithymum TaxID=186058 RepID=A0AAV0ED87_9ASTE|nr:unnamed protein product [Cuscuta epithymum]
MVDSDLDDFDAAPKKAQVRPSRFAPKGSKPGPQLSKVKKEPVSSSNSVLPEPNPVPIGKKEEFDSKTIPVTSHIPKSNLEEDGSTSDGLQMDVDMKPDDGNREQDHDEPMFSEGEEDEVVREIDIYLTPSTDPNTKLYVLQYPLRPKWRPYELEERCKEVRVKPVSSEVEVDLALDFDSKNYDSSEAARLKMTKQTLSTSWKPTPSSTGYAVGVLAGNKLHLNPIHAVVQLRPATHHLTSSGTDKTGGAKEQKPIVSTNKQTKPQETIEDKNTEESWVCLKYHHGQSDTSFRYLQKMVEVEGSSIQFSMSPYDYMNTMCPRVMAESDKVKAHPPYRLLNSLQVEERIKSWLLEGPPIHRFNALRYLAPEESPEEILRILQKHALLVQGLWVPKSSLVYGKESGIEVLARDYVLSLLSKAPSIQKSILNDLVPAFEKAMKEVLNVLTVERSILKDWKLKENPDPSFLKHYPKVAMEQAASWERRQKGLHDVVSRANSKRHGKQTLDTTMTTKNSPAQAAQAAQAVPDKQGLKTVNATLSRTSMSEETREALPKALMKLFKIHSVCSIQQICQRLREMAVSETVRPKGDAREAQAAALGVDAPLEELRSIINQVAVNIHDVYVLKSSPENPQYDSLRKVVIDLFIADGPNAKLKKASILEAAKLQLKRDISDAELRKVLNELCVSQHSAWLLKRGDGSSK